ncbi:hypothetical protein COLO4_13643 [Corchorus olitorius]|uniref:Uncharacterized protein n=1 Tax=Corchorus olitorius TaxID=93759 RepID=A0A1R3JVM5_9ROSI|nr:hypothetical protein COLO4_13643 [Corchorus olitorius]
MRFDCQRMRMERGGVSWMLYVEALFRVMLSWLVWSPFRCSFTLSPLHLTFNIFAVGITCQRGCQLVPWSQ